MYENIRPAVLWRDEAVAFGRVEPLNLVCIPSGFEFGITLPDVWFGILIGSDGGFEDHLNKIHDKQEILKI